MNDRLYREAKELICRVLEIPERELGDETRFVEDLGIDSILIVELKTRFEERFGLKIAKESLPELNTLRGVMELLARPGAS